MTIRRSRDLYVVLSVCGLIHVRYLKEVLLLTVRKATISDAKQLSQLAEQTFRDTFAAMNTVEDMELHCQNSYSENIQASEISNPNMVTFLSEDEDRLVGFAQLRWGESPSCVLAQSPAEIQRLYIVKDWHGKGIAQDLMKACLEELKGQRADVVWLGVWERNPRAISFYKKFGFVEVGEHVFPLGSDPQRDIVMARPVISS
ncbi:MAG: GNAT family N-acetyltransferase [Acidobacteria bacterium]|nr:GNAT family N-acetyltransferase [Acidobacteriota bacterium]